MSCKKLFTVVYLIIFLLAINPVYGKSAGESTGQILELGGGALLPAMGGAGQASVGGPASLEYNPAGLAGEKKRKFEFSYMTLVEGINYGNFGFSQPYDHNVTWAGGLRVLDYGSVDETVTESSDGGDRVDSVGEFNDVDAVVSGALAGKLTDELQWGVAPRIVRLEAYEEAVGPALDVGLQWHPRSDSLPFSLGLVVANMGPGLKFEEQTENLPLLAQGGASLYLAEVGGPDIDIHGELEHHPNDSENFYRFGAEWLIYDLFSLRMGYDNSRDIDDKKFTYGFGYHSESKNLEFNYALVPQGDFDHVHRFGFTFFMPAPELGEKPAEKSSRDNRGRVKGEKTGEEQEQIETGTGVLYLPGLETENGETSDEFSMIVPDQPDVKPGELPGLEFDPPKLLLEELDIKKKLSAGRVAFARGNYRKALENFVEVYKVWPESVDVLLLIGITEMELGNKKNARQIFKRVLELDPGNEAALVNLHRLLR
ncbi:MAG: PorV/PorQ family protein [bacterium]